MVAGLRWLPPPPPPLPAAAPERERAPERGERAAAPPSSDATSAHRAGAPGNQRAANGRCLGAADWPRAPVDRPTNGVGCGVAAGHGAPSVQRRRHRPPPPATEGRGGRGGSGRAMNGYECGGKPKPVIDPIGPDRRVATWRAAAGPTRPLSPTTTPGQRRPPT